MTDEYNSLRKEIIEWQNRRFLILGITITLVSGILGLKTNAVSSNISLYISSILLFILASSSCLIWYCGRASAKIAAYLIVFHEERSEQGSGWESRLNKLKKSKKDWFDLNKMMFLVYLVLGCLSVFLPYLYNKDKCSVTLLNIIPLIITTIFYIIGLYLLLQKSKKKYYIQLWRN
jgi:undecaprenyl pyrophosphate phosphatase UppP